MKKVITGLRTLFGSNTSSKNDSYLTWARTEYKSDWQFAYQHMLDNDGAAPTRKDLHPWNEGANKNLQGWV